MDQSCHEDVMDCEDAPRSLHDKDNKKAKIVTAKDIASLLSNHLTCAICHDWLAGTHALSCGHMFCGVCLASWLTHKHSCPECRKPTAGASIRLLAAGLAQGLGRAGFMEGSCRARATDNPHVLACAEVYCTGAGRRRAFFVWKSMQPRTGETRINLPGVLSVILDMPCKPAKNRMRPVSTVCLVVSPAGVPVRCRNIDNTIGDLFSSNLLSPNSKRERRRKQLTW